MHGHREEPAGGGRGGRGGGIGPSSGQASKAFLLREKSFTFDMVFDEHEQEAVYNECAYPLVKSVLRLQRYNICVWADWERQDVHHDGS